MNNSLHPESHQAFNEACEKLNVNINSLAAALEVHVESSEDSDAYGLARLVELIEEAAIELANFIQAISIQGNDISHDRFSKLCEIASGDATVIWTALEALAELIQSAETHGISHILAGLTQDAEGFAASIDNIPCSFTEIGA
jgi:hypothetical protein